jgi:hypothetical protein
MRSLSCLAAILLFVAVLAAVVIGYSGVPFWFALKSRNNRLLSQIVQLQGIRALPQLERAMHSEHAEERRAVVLALSYLEAKRSDAAVGLLIQALEDPNIYVRSAALETLGRLGPTGSEAVPKLGMLLDDPSVAIRLGALQALGSIGPSARQVADKLNRLINDDVDPDVRERAAWAREMVLKAGD